MTLDQIDDFYRAHGYIRMSEPVDGQEVDYLASQRSAVAAIEEAMTRNSKLWGTRGRSQKALGILHLDLPNPAWGVEVS